MTDNEYKQLSKKEFAKAAKVYETDGDVHVYSVAEVSELCRKAGLTLESGEKRGFFRLHCVARK